MQNCANILGFSHSVCLLSVRSEDVFGFQEEKKPDQRMNTLIIINYNK